MDATQEHFAYRCLPLNIANSHGWELLSPCGFEAEWNGGSAVNDVVIRPDPGTELRRAPVALFGQGTFTFHVEGLFRTPEGFNLWVGGSPNFAKDGVAPLGGIIETDWSPYSFTMNWRFTRPHHVIRFEENEPFCFFFPVERRLVEAVHPAILPIDADPELKQQFEAWSASRDAFQLAITQAPPDAPSKKWQKYYYRGLHLDGSAGTADHQSKLRVAEFAGAEPVRLRTPIAAPPSARDPSLATWACPARGQAELRDAAGAAKLAWMLTTQQRLRALAPCSIPHKADITPASFLADHYAANLPVVLDSELTDWPALDRWRPDYLKRVVGTATVEVQSGRARDPDYERNMAAHRTAMPFNLFIDRITRRDAANDLYLTAYNSAANAAALAPLHGDLGFLDKLLDPAGGTPRGMLWIGPAGTFTPLHHDLTNNLLLQIIGRKRVLLVAPADTPRLYNDHHVYSRVRDLSEPHIVRRFPALDGVQVHEVILEPGDSLFLPLGWWHQVTALDFSVSITHTNFRWLNDFHESHPS